mmetsp:Transcript_26501/g.76491  ORF Transcript_26501/g.76491 Transcript_26501/m.76491 type:complete len:784 (+) Transcript_26501:157-2508(+)|eukprot:CAMPEP_0181027380 /NCGR_PEP_ID=MMETSP1070-20121207/4135_1 /TAXON_ID=265543 /ORGANISM="Minutocellus polymorphus, Strain NH13" /LENGTH=783 /DNA_ID=CAMNT_0023104621 /DNA_START=106 /DNA_END=2457 /DNA_ORIENTATION=+
MSVSCGRRIGSGVSGGRGCSPAKKKTMTGLAGLVVQCWLLINSTLAAAQTVYSSTTNSNAYGGVGITDVGEISRPGPASNTPATNSDKKYLLYRVPPFEASLTFPDPGFQNHRGQTALMDIDESLDGITSRYLFDFVFRYMEGLSRQHKRPLAQRLHSLEVRADLYEVDEKGNILVGPNVDGRQRREKRLLRSINVRGGDFGSYPKERRTSSFIPGAKPANNDQYANLPPKYIVAEFTGTASFEDYRYDPNDFDVVMGEGVNSEDDVVIDVDEATLRLMIGKALKQTNAYLQELWTATDHLVASVTAASLRMDLDLGLADKVVSSGGAGSSGSDFYYGAPPKSEPSPQSGGAQSASGTGLGSTSLPTPAADEGLSTREISTIAVMAFFLVGLVGFIFIYMKREYHHGHGHSGPSRIPRSDEDSDPYSPAALRRNKNGFLEFCDDWGTESVSEEDGVYPVGTGTPPVSSRRYVSLDSGQVMYGASYTPPETEQVQAHYAAQQRNVSKKKKKPKRNLTLISPMMTLVEEEPPPPPPSRFSELPRSRNGHQLGSTNDKQMYAYQQGAGLMSSLSPSLNIVQNVSSFFESVTGGPSPNAGRQSITSPTGVESFIPPVPYKDFPRNDGTPCVIFSDSEQSLNDWELSSELRERQALTAMSVEVGMSGVRETDHSNSIHSHADEDEPIITEEGIVDFVGKLEHLMTLKSRQYAERIKMEKERAERAERRRKERASAKTLSPLKVSGRANPQAASVGSPPTSEHGADKDRSQLIPMLIPEEKGNMNTIQL